MCLEGKAGWASRAAGVDLYSKEVTARTYDALFANARLALRAGYPVILDAAFLRREERVQDPVALARFVLRDEPAWTEDRIRQAMAKGASSTVSLKHPLPVLIAYGTVIIKGGREYFYSDLYGHDRLLDQALRERSSRSTAD
jgi:hypothetical protein